MHRRGGLLASASATAAPPALASASPALGADCASADAPDAAAHTCAAARGCGAARGLSRAGSPLAARPPALVSRTCVPTGYTGFIPAEEEEQLRERLPVLLDKLERKHRRASWLEGGDNWMRREVRAAARHEVRLLRPLAERLGMAVPELLEPGCRAAADDDCGAAAAAAALLTSAALWLFDLHDSARAEAAMDARRLARGVLRLRRASDAVGD